MKKDLNKECKQCGLDGGTHIFDCPLGHTKHNFKYSHQERIPTFSTGTNETILDVMICKVCGQIKRQKV